MTDDEQRFTLRSVTSLVERISGMIDQNYFRVTPVSQYDDMFVEGDTVFVQNYIIGEEDENAEDVFANDNFVVWSNGIKFFSDAGLIDRENQFFMYTISANILYKMQIPMQIPKDMEARELEDEYADTPDKVELKKSGLDFDDVEVKNRSLSGIVNPEIQGVDSELIISADVLKRRLVGKNMDKTLKYAIMTAKTTKKNIEALNFALSSCSRNYTHTAWHLMYALLDIYRHIDRQSQK